MSYIASYMKRFCWGEKPVPKSMPIGEMRMIIYILKEVRQTATMESANFFYGPDRIDQEARMQEIREVSEGWRNCWIINPLDELIERYEDTLRNRGKG